MTNLDFLNGFSLQAAPEPQKGTRAASGPRLERRPEKDADLRVFKNGRVYPSKDFQEKYALDFLPKQETVDPVTGNVLTTVLGNGLDFIDSKKWVMTSNLEQHVLFVGITPRQGNGKIDIMAGCKYNEDGTPSRSVMEMGAYTYGREQLVPMIAEILGIDWETTAYVDIKVVTDYPMVSPNGFYILPKLVARGEHKGQSSFIRREETTIFPVVLVSAKQIETKPKIEPIDNIEVQTEQDDRFDPSESNHTPSENILDSLV